MSYDSPYQTAVSPSPKYSTARTCHVVIVWTSSTSSYDTVTRCTSGSTSSLPVVMSNTSRTGASACTDIVWISGAHAKVHTWQLVSEENIRTFGKG